MPDYVISFDGSNIKSTNPQTVRENMHPNENRFVDINELAEILRIAKGTLYQWVYLRRIPFIKASRCLRFDAKEVVASLRHFRTIEAAGKR